MNLPEDAIIIICNYLDLFTISKDICLVNKQFNHCCYARRQVLNMECWTQLNNNSTTSTYRVSNLTTKKLKSYRSSVLNAYRNIYSVLSNCAQANEDKKAHFEQVYLDRCAFVDCLKSSTSFNEFLTLCGNDLKVLSFRGCTCVNDNMLNTLTSHPISSSLTSLNLSGNKNISDIGIAAIANTCQRLKQLGLRGCFNLTNKSLNSLAQSNCKNTLTSLDLHGMIANDMSVHTISQLENLEWLNVQNMHSFSGGDLEDCLSNSTTAFRNIQYLNLIGVASVTDRTLELLFTFCNKITYLEIQNNKLITDQGANCIRNVVNLNVISCSNIGSIGFKNIADNNPLLERIEAKELIQIDDNSVLHMIDVCPRLHTLNLAYTNVTDRVLERTIQDTNIRILNLHACPSVKDAKVYLFSHVVRQLP
jgi:hypothetical protein